MRELIAFIATVVLLVAVALAAQAPEKLVFESKYGNVTFDHAGHAKRAKGDCTVCHDKLFPQSRAPLKFKEGMHKPAEAKRISCGACHRPGGEAFASQGNCVRCHGKK